MFSQYVQERLRHYVYRLVDPVSDETFYVGKGRGNRAFEHEGGAQEMGGEGEKLARIREIDRTGNRVVHVIHRHGLTAESALEVEAALIDVYGLENLTNQVFGLEREERGAMRAEEVSALYEAEPAVITEPAILININKLWHQGIGEDELYKITRGWWACQPNKRTPLPVYAMPIKSGVIREVYEIEGDWYPVDANSQPPRNHIEMRLRAADPAAYQGQDVRQMFDGNPAPSQIRQRYVGKAARNYFTPGARNPVKYVNC